MALDTVTPQPSSGGKLRVVRLRRKRNESLGFAVRGGLEHGIGVYVSHVMPGSQAHHQGLRAGDELVRVNGYTISHSVHEEVLALIKAKRDLVLRVRNVGIIPVKDQPERSLQWKQVKKTIPDNNEANLENRKETVTIHTHGDSGIELLVNLPDGTSLGCSIREGSAEHRGIYVQSVTSGSLAEEAGLKVGDQLMEVNTTDLRQAGYSQAVEALKSSQHLKMIVKKGAGKDLFGPSSFAESKESPAAMKKKTKSIPRPKLVQNGDKLCSSQEMKVRVNGADIERTESQRQRSLPHQGTELRSPGQATGRSSEESESQPTSPEPTEPAQPTERATKSDERTKHHKAAVVSGVQPSVTASKIRQAARPGPSKPVVSRSRHDRLQQKENAALKREHDRRLSASEGMTSDDTKVTESRSTKAAPQILGPSYMNTAAGPSYRIQKPVLLSPVGPPPRPDRKQSSGSIIPEEFEEGEISEESFNPYRLFTNEQIAGRQIRLLNIRKLQSDLGLTLYERGQGQGETHICIKAIEEGGAAYKQGGIHIGDQLMVVEWTSLLGVSLRMAREILEKAYSSGKAVMQVVVAKAPPRRTSTELEYVSYI